MIAHGTPSQYVHGCRCDECRMAAVAYVKAYRKAKPEQYRAAWRDQKARWRARTGKH